MSNVYYPKTSNICHNFYNNGGCTFCGYNLQERTVSATPLGVEDMIQDFETFAHSNFEEIKTAGKLVIAPNGSWFTQVPEALRESVYGFVDRNSIPFLKYESRATLFNPDKARKELEIMYAALYAHNPLLVEEKTGQAVDALAKALGEVSSNHIVGLGLEVARDEDLAILNKGCCLDDYVSASAQIHDAGARVGCNILIAPPGVENSVYRAFETAKYSLEVLGAHELLLMPCIPMKGTKGYDMWQAGEWNPISATAASEILRTIRGNYSDLEVKYNSMRVYAFTGKKGKYKRQNPKWSDEEKAAERQRVREIASQVFSF